ncbi:MAG: ExbD/TolR family protein [Fusobacteriota bacterium]
MKFRKIKRRTGGDIFLELTPLIDVVFLLLIFFMVSTTFVDINTGINIVLPHSTVNEISQSREVIITVTEKEKIYVNKEQVDINELQFKIEEVLMENKKDNVIIKADKNLSHGLIVDIMTKSKNAGATEIDIATQEK